MTSAAVNKLGRRRLRFADGMARGLDLGRLFLLLLLRHVLTPVFLVHNLLYFTTLNKQQVVRHVSPEILKVRVSNLTASAE